MSDLIDRKPSQKHDSNTLDALECVSRKAAIDAVGSMLRRKFGIGGDLAEITLSELPSVQPDENMIHLQKEQAYMQGWEDGREALRKEILDER